MTSERHRRRHPRVHPKGVVAHVRALSRTLVCQVENLSECGAFVRTDQILPIGTPLELDLVKPGARKSLHLSGTVASSLGHAQSQRTAPGIGIAFEVPDEAEAERLRAVVAAAGIVARAAPTAKIVQQGPAATIAGPGGEDGAALDPDAFGASSKEERLRVAPRPAEASAPAATAQQEGGSEADRLMVQIRGLMFELGELRAQLQQRDAELREARADLRVALERIDELERQR